LNYYNCHSSRSYLDKPDILNTYLRELFHFVYNILPDDKEVMIICREAHKEAIKSYIDKEFSPIRAGMMHLIHWGEHKGINEFSTVEYFFTIGMLYRDPNKLAANILGQMGNINGAMSINVLHEVQMSLQTESMYQAISRCNSRRLNDGFAGTSHLYVFHPKKDQAAIDGLIDICPGIQVTEYKPKHLNKLNYQSNSAGYLSMSELMMSFLKDFVGDMISIKELKKRTSINTGGSTWRRARKHFLDEQFEWELNSGGRSFVRI
jgi:hypothetical protein